MESIRLREALLCECVWGEGLATPAHQSHVQPQWLEEMEGGVTCWGRWKQDSWGRVLCRYEHVCPCAHGHSQAAGQMGLGVRR